MTRNGRIATLIAVLGASILFYQQHNTPEPLDISTIRPIAELPTPILEAEDVLVQLDPKEFACMQKNIFYEARNEKSDAAFAAVGYSVIQRMENKHYPSTACGVVEQKKFVSRKNRWVCMYSWFCDGKSDVPDLSNPIERKAWERSGEIAALVMKKEIDNPIPNATMYHATYIKPKWDYSKLVYVATVGTHIYYQEKARI